MNHISVKSSVTTLETSRLLQAANFPQEAVSHRWFVPATGGDVHLQRSKNKKWDYRNFVAPTAEEISLLLPLRAHNQDLSITKTEGGYVAWYDLMKSEGHGDSLAEALAGIWLKLNGPASED